jgi:hypothetical protein
LRGFVASTTTAACGRPGTVEEPDDFHGARRRRR